MARDTLEEFYNINFALMQHHGYTLHDLEQMLPWERDIYVLMLSRYVKEENEKLRDEQQRRRTG
jgi:hypothetical protein